MKKVLVVGCSHSDFHSLSEDNCEFPWNWFIADRYPNIEVHNYALKGMSNFYSDMVLKKVIAENLQFDAVIVNLTEPSRFTLPLNYTNFISWNCNTITGNYFDYKLDAAYCRIFSDSCSTPKDKNVNQIFLNNIANYTKESKLILYYNNIFIKSLKLYENYFSNFFYWCAFPSVNNINNKNNINQKFSAIEFLNKTYGQRYTFKHFLEPGLHINKKGAEVLFDDYIMPSAIGDFLKLS